MTEQGYEYEVVDENRTKAEEQVEKAEESTTKAIAPIFNVDRARHHLMADKEREYSERARKELELEEELGLRNQAGLTQEEILQKDIDELTSSRDFYEVDSKILARLFGMRGLKKKCDMHNLREFISVTYRALKWEMLLLGVSVALTVGLIEAWRGCYDLMAASSLDVYHIIGTILVGAAAFTGFCFLGYRLCSGKHFEYEFMKVELRSEDLVQTRVRIPYGAMLKTAEAKRTEIFTQFGLVRPEFKTLKTEKGWEPIDLRRALPTDPAIVGHTEDGRQFLIVYWDIEKDRARVLRNIAQFKKHKLKKI
ncbi:MAG: hypothetical protein GF334_11035 [Candidatus Altiarchaeales archaeon]|nr:hypothetical protein [Candidatus Altiarchaeales archaeon]